MITIRVDVPRDLLRRLSPEERRRIKSGALEETMLYLETGTAEKTPVNLGPLRASIAHQQLRGLGANLRGEVFSNRDYAPAVERGRRPGSWPPKAPIVDWVRRKLGYNVYADEVAYLVRRKIFRQGIKAVRMFKRTADGSGPAVERIWSRWIGRI